MGFSAGQTYIVQGIPVPVPATGIMYDGTGAVWQKLTRDIPVLNPTHCSYSLLFKCPMIHVGNAAFY